MRVVSEGGLELTSHALRCIDVPNRARASASTGGRRKDNDAWGSASAAPPATPARQAPDETYEDWARRVSRLSEENEEQLLALDLDQLREMGVRCDYEEPPRRGAS